MRADNGRACLLEVSTHVSPVQLRSETRTLRLLELVDCLLQRLYQVLQWKKESNVAVRNVSLGTDNSDMPIAAQPPISCLEGCYATRSGTDKIMSPRFCSGSSLHCYRRAFQSVPEAMRHADFNHISARDKSSNI